MSVWHLLKDRCEGISNRLPADETFAVNTRTTRGIKDALLREHRHEAIEVMRVPSVDVVHQQLDTPFLS